MDKQTKILLALGGAAIVGYYIWKQSKSSEKNNKKLPPIISTIDNTSLDLKPKVEEPTKKEEPVITEGGNKILESNLSIIKDRAADTCFDCSYTVLYKDKSTGNFYLGKIGKETRWKTKYYESDSFGNQMVAEYDYYEIYPMGLIDCPEGMDC